MQKRNETIDILKGIAVLAVLLGHAIQRGLIINYETNIFFKIIYSFHMPLFVILSGYSLHHFTKKYNVSFLIKRFCRLIIPTITWSYLIYFVRDFNFVGIKNFVPFPPSVLEYTKILLHHPDYIIWFLYIIFICDLIFFSTKKLVQSENEIIQLLMIITITLIIQFLPNQNFGILRLQIYFPMFALGYYLSKYSIILDFTKYLVLPSTFLYLFLFPKFSVLINSKFIYYLISISSLIIIYNLVKYFFKHQVIHNILTFFGKRSLEIYLCQCVCLNIGISNGYIRIISIFITATFFSSILSIITNKSRISKLLLYGKF